MIDSENFTAEEVHLTKIREAHGGKGDFLLDYFICVLLPQMLEFDR